jgi:hypothetical protein
MFQSNRKNAFENTHEYLLSTYSKESIDAAIKEYYRENFRWLDSFDAAVNDFDIMTTLEKCEFLDLWGE